MICKHCKEEFNLDNKSSIHSHGYCTRTCFNKYLNRKPKASRRATKQDVKELNTEVSFYNSREWKRLRYQALIKFGHRCLLCGARAPNVQIHVDHIKPRHLFPQLALDINNLQTLCRDCNLGKGAKYHHDFRPHEYK